MRTKEWFYGKCVDLVEETQDLEGKAWRALKLGISGVDNTRGHMNHAVGVAQKFLEETEDMTAEINQFDLENFDLRSEEAVYILNSFQEWIAPKTGYCGRQDYNYNFDTFKSLVTYVLGGTRTGGGGADNEFHIALRLAAHFNE